MEWNRAAGHALCSIPGEYPSIEIRPKALVFSMKIRYRGSFEIGINQRFSNWEHFFYCSQKFTCSNFYLNLQTCFGFVSVIGNPP
jgi:hypothetical protein